MSNSTGTKSALVPIYRMNSFPYPGSDVIIICVTDIIDVSKDV